MEQYDNDYAGDNVYGHVVDLTSRFGLRAGEVFLDFGCGYGRMAEVLRDRHQLHYIGLDIDEPALLSLKERGFETMFVDLRDPDAALALIDQYLPQSVRVGALCIIDTLEHIVEPVKALLMLRTLAQRHGAPLLISVPNVAHRDIGFKLAMGMFDYTESGLLDHTHLQYFTEQRVCQMMAFSGWHEVHQKDVFLPESDQHFPREHAALSARAPLHQLLRRLRAQVSDTDQVNQFVRAYLPGPLVGATFNVPFVRERESRRPFLTVVTRTQGTRIGTLRETLLCLSAQTCQDFEVCVVGHDLDVDRQLEVERVIADLHASIRNRVSLVRVSGGSRAAPLNAGFENAHGHYVAVLDDDDLVFGNWIETFCNLAEACSGQLLRLVAVAQHWDKVTLVNSQPASRAVGPMEPLYPEKFDLVSHIIENRSPLHSLAFPRSVFSDLQFRFDDYLTTAEDWDFIIRVAPLTGVAASETVGCIYRLWKTGETSFTVHSELEWRANYFYTLRKLDRAPLLMPVGSASRIRGMYEELSRHRAVGGMPFTQPELLPSDPDSGSDKTYLEALRNRYHQLIHSASWRVTEPVRGLMRLIKRNRRAKIEKIWLLDTTDLEYLIRDIETSSSWKKTRWMRELRRVIRG